MITAKCCPACAGASHTSWPALVAPFIQNYALNHHAGHCRLVECRSCGLRYFDKRYEPKELARLYGDYRGVDYQAARQRDERGYTRQFNEGLGDDAETRNAALREFLKRNALTEIDRDVVDYGGDRGDYIPNCFVGRRYVYDISGKPTIDGVERIDNVADLEILKPEFVLLAHVLEHLPDPSEVLSHIGKIMPPGGVLYVEVPLERPALRWLAKGPGYGRWLDFISRHAFLLRVMAVYDATARKLFGVIPPLGCAVLHEHINFFHAPSLRALLERSGFGIVSIETEQGLVRALAEQNAGPVTAS
ncbi:MAG: class I SAM-dependent methyltransferase [Caulobacteraceae bacterium]